VVSNLLPSEVALETFNSHYLQKHPGSARATLAFAKALKILGAPLEEIENSLLNLSHPEANLNIKVK
jgi:N-alpha-acetyltransferase 15/16, NatA auxiliary subunit